MKKSQITLTGGAAVTPIPASIRAHSIKIIELGLAPVGLIVNWPDDSFVANYNYAAGAVIRKSGHGIHGVLARPANSAYGNTPATADNYCKIKASNNNAAVVVELTEYEFGEDSAS